MISIKLNFGPAWREVGSDDRIRINCPPSLRASARQTSLLSPLEAKMVEAAGIEPASENLSAEHLHT